MKTLTFQETLNLDSRIYADVRAPMEYEADHIPGAVNLPLFDDDQRAEIGTLYKNAGKEAAVLRGTELIGPGLGRFTEEFSRYRDRNIIIYCARGGMRSGSVSSLLSELGFPVVRLDEGYKGYRRFINRYFENLRPLPELFVLQGLTGSGKTEIIRSMDPLFTLDPEFLAGHRSSVFGGLGLKPRTQKAFESGLFGRLELLSGSPFIVTEGEARKIGNLHIPVNLFRLMEQSTTFRIETDIERRTDIILKEYSSACTDDVLTVIKGLEVHAGKNLSAELLRLYENGELRLFVRMLLEKYYDPRYIHAIKGKKFAAVIQNRNSAQAAEEITEIIREILKNKKYSFM